MSEIWKTIKGYEVSNVGRVRSLDRIVTCKNGRVLRLKWKVRSLVLCGRGYLRVSISNNGIHSTQKVHRLVAEAFIPNPNNYPQVNHKNGIKTDNRVENLEWCDRSQNIRHAFGNGLSNNKGEKNPQSKLTERQVTEIKARLLQGQRNIDLAKIYGVNKNTISHIKTGRNWKGVGVLP